MASALIAAAGLLSACSGDTPVEDDVDSAVLLPQSLFPNGGQVSECPALPESDTDDTVGGIPKAVCVTVTNTGDDRAVYAVPVTVQSRADDPIVISQVTVTTSAIDPGATGAAAIAAPGTEKVLDDWADGQQEAQEEQGYVPLGDTQLLVGTVVRTPA